MHDEKTSTNSTIFVKWYYVHQILFSLHVQFSFFFSDRHQNASLSCTVSLELFLIPCSCLCKTHVSADDEETQRFRWKYISGRGYIFKNLEHFVVAVLSVICFLFHFIYFVLVFFFSSAPISMVVQFSQKPYSHVSGARKSWRTKECCTFSHSLCTQNSVCTGHEQ